jgi:hypothetical protein
LFFYIPNEKNQQQPYENTVGALPVGTKKAAPEPWRNVKLHAFVTVLSHFGYTSLLIIQPGGPD